MSFLFSALRRIGLHLFLLLNIASVSAVEAVNPVIRDVTVQQSLTLDYAWGINSNRSEILRATYEGKSDLHIGEYLKFHGAIYATADAFDRLEPGTPSRDEASPWTQPLLEGAQGRLELREFYLQGYRNGWSWTVGKQQIVWGNSDKLRVLDRVNPFNFELFILPDFADSRIPLWSLNLELVFSEKWEIENEFLQESTLQWIWLPDTTYHHFPQNGLFAFTSPIFNPLSNATLPTTVNQANKPNHFFSDSDVGFQWSTFWQGWDLTLNYLYHYDDTPVFRRDLILGPQAPMVDVTPEYYRVHMIGGSASTALGNHVLRTEIAWLLDKPLLTESLLDNDGIITTTETSTVLGWDWYGWEDQVFSLQWFNSFIPSHAHESTRDRVESTVTFFWKAEIQDAKWIPQILCLQSINRGDGLFSPRLTHVWNDDLLLSVGVDVFYGSGEGLFGQFNRNDRVTTQIECHF